MTPAYGTINTGDILAGAAARDARGVVVRKSTRTTRTKADATAEEAVIWFIVVIL